MIVLISVYGVIAFIVFTLFMFPAFQDWRDYSTKDICNHALFSVCAGLLWPIIAVLLIALMSCGMYYSRKDGKDTSNDEED